MGKIKYSKQLLNIVAKEVAEYVYDNMFSVHRGIYEADNVTDILFIFGNDGYRNDKKARNEANAVKAEAISIGCKISDIKTCPDGYSWAIAVVGSYDDASLLLDVAKHTWWHECGFDKIAKSA